MTQPPSSGGSSLNPDPQLVYGIDVDALAAAVRSCAGVDDLDGGRPGSVTSYLPGRKVAGIKVETNRVTVQIRSRWAVPIADVGAQIRAALLPVIEGRLLDVVVCDIADPPGVSTHSTTGSRAATAGGSG